MCYEPPSINFLLGQTAHLEPRGRGWPSGLPEGRVRGTPAIGCGSVLSIPLIRPLADARGHLLPQGEKGFHAPLAFRPAADDSVAPMTPTLVLLVVGLTPSLLGENTPNLNKLVLSGGVRPLRTVLPAVTCTVQSTLLTGLMPSRARRRGERLVLSRPCRGAGCGGSRTGSSPARRSGRRAGRATRPSPAPRCSGGTTCTRRPTGAPRRGRCTPPTAARFPTITPSRRSCATS